MCLNNPNRIKERTAHHLNARDAGHAKGAEWHKFDRNIHINRARVHFVNVPEVCC